VHISQIYFSVLPTLFLLFIYSFYCSLYDQVFKPSKLLANADFHLFKTGIEPKWEDPECANGGKWSVTVSRKPQLDTMWLETVFILPLFLCHDHILWHLF
jgi:Eukaryotic initiation factor 4E